MPLLAVMTALGLGALAAMTGASLAAVLLVGLALPTAAAVWRGRLDHVAGTILFLALAVDDPRGRPYMGMWEGSPLRPLGNVLFDSLGKSLGISAIKVFGIELCLAALAVMVIARSIAARGKQSRPPWPVILAAGVSVACVVLLELWGLARGGNLRFSMLQMRPMLMMGVSLIIFAHIFRTERSPFILMGAIIAAGVVRAWVGIYFWQTTLIDTDEADLLSFGGGGYITSHADTVLWVAGLFICLTALLEKPSVKVLALNVFAAVPMVIAIIANNRRVAAMCILLGLIVVYLGAGMLLRRKIHRMLVITGPALALYVVSAWNAQGVWASPVQSVRSVFTSEDTSASMRDIENYNLLRTARKHLVFGSGLGHEYEEEVVAISIEDLLEAYRYLPHNSLLWLLGAAGIVGTLLYWMMFPVAVFFAVRQHDLSRRSIDRVGALVAITTVTTYGTQCYADMGMVGWMPVLVTSAMLGLAAGRAGALEALR